MVKNLMLHFPLIGSWTGWSFFFQVLEAVFTVSYLLVGYGDQCYHSDFNSFVFLLYLFMYLSSLKAFRIFFSLVFGNFMTVCLCIDPLSISVLGIWWGPSTGDLCPSILGISLFLSCFPSFFSVLSESSQLSLCLLFLLFVFLCPFHSIF